MRFLFLALVLLALALLAATPVAGQAPPPVRLPAATVADWQGRTVTWRSYDGRTRTATATVYGNEADDRADRPYTVVLADDATNREPITEDARFLADLVGRELGVDPVRLAFLFRFALEGERRQPLTVRATVRRSSAGRLVSPSWRVLSSEEVEDYTSRALR